MLVCADSDKAVRDTFWHGRLVLWQPARGHGYRFNLDPVLLAGFVQGGQHVLDLGAGCGILGLLLLATGKAQTVTAVEVQPFMAELARRNAQENGFAERLQVVGGDLRSLQLPPAASVVFNPPYFRQGEGRASPHPGREAGRREVHGTLGDFVACAVRHRLPGAECAAIVPQARAAELKLLFEAHDLRPCEFREVRPRADIPTQHVLLRAPGAGVPTAPLVVHQADGRAFTPEVEAWVDGTCAAQVPLL